MANNLWYITNSKSGLVLEDSHGKVILQHLTKYPQQKWIKESAGHGMFYLKNRGTGCVLDVASGKAITRPLNRDLPQRWNLNDNGTITNCVNGHALDIPESNWKAFENIIVFPKHGGPNQQFHLTLAA